MNFTVNEDRINVLLIYPGSLHLFAFVTLLILSILIFAPTISAQQDDEARDHHIQIEFAPPPLRIISRDERSKLEQETKVKDRTRLSLDFMDSRLKAAEARSSGADFDGVFRELGYFHGLMDDGFTFLDEQNGSRGRVLDNFKRFEIALRRFLPRLETIRRELPVRYEDYVKNLMRYVRDTRAKAVEPLFGETVLRPPQQRPTPEPE